MALSFTWEGLPDLAGWPCLHGPGEVPKVKEYFFKCVVDPKMKCFPRLNSLCQYHTWWDYLVTLWATTLDGHSFNISMVEGSSGDFRSVENSMIRATEIPRLLTNPDAVIVYCNTGEFNHDVCLDLIRSRYMWTATRKDGMSLLQAISSFQTKNKGGIKDWMRSKVA